MRGGRMVFPGISMTILRSILPVVFIVGCGGNPAPPPAEAVDACNQLQQARAQRAARCIGGSEADWLAFDNTLDNCAVYAQYVSDGTVTYRPSAWAACLQEYQASCSQSVNSCFYDVLAGAVPDGQACTAEDVCESSSNCVSTNGDACATTCVPPSAESQPCGTFCDVGLFCLNGSCAKTKGPGEDCGGPENVVCDDGLYCQPDTTASDSSGICIQLSDGNSCVADAECIASDFCYSGVCVQRRVVGSPCDGAATGCVPWSACDGSTCVEAGRTGQPCAAFPGTAIPYCMGATICGVGSRCEPLPGPGGDCSILPCASGYVCSPTSMTCGTC